MDDRSFFRVAGDIMSLIEREEQSNIERAAESVIRTLESGSLVHVFGSGHSHMVAEEMFERAGGLLGINAMLEPSVMPHSKLGSFIERQGGVGKIIFDYYVPHPVKMDTMIVISNSGRNPLPIEIALSAKDEGMTVVAITSLSHSRAFASKHTSGRKLFEVSDIAIDTHVPAGDSSISISGNISVAPLSTVAGVCIANELVRRTVIRMIRDGKSPPVLRSGNLDGSSEHNATLMKRYAGKGRLL